MITKVIPKAIMPVYETCLRMFNIFLVDKKYGLAMEEMTNKTMRAINGA